MERTERLFALMDSLRRRRQPVTARKLATELDVSLRTLYRDVQLLVGLGAPIEGEAGVGYVLRPGFFLPPLMFQPDELEALVLGARWVRAQGDAGLTEAVSRALGKIAAAAPEDLRQSLELTGLFWPVRDAEAVPWLSELRQGIREQRKLQMCYAATADNTTERVIWPVALAYSEHTKVLAAWCELRQGFRHFRVERIQKLSLLGEVYPCGHAELLSKWREEKGIPTAAMF